MESRLSVVVPVYNVEHYLQECLESIAAQTFPDFDVVMVDDGSTDSSADVARSFAALDPRFRLVRQENQGLGAARNAGLLHISATSEYLAFVDSDDTLPPYAYRLLVDTLDGTGSDFATGNVMRFRSVGATPSPVHRKPFQQTVLRTHITRTQALITDRTAWNKVYRRAFWAENNFRYPEGLLYEDAPVSIPAHFAAECVDVLSTPVYNWREREAGGPSITQQRTDPRGLRDRVTSIALVRRFLAARSGAGAEAHLRMYDENVVNEELGLFAKVLVEAGDDYRADYIECVGALLRQLHPDVLRDCCVSTRLNLHLTAAGRLDDLLCLIAFQNEFNASVPVRGVLRPRAAFPFLKDRPPVPKEVLRLGGELRLEARLQHTGWHGDRFRFSGSACARHLGAAHRLTSPKVVTLREAGSRRTLVLPARTVPNPCPATDVEQTLRSCDWAGFEVEVAVDRLRHKGRWREGMWRVTVAAPAGLQPRRTRIKAEGSGSARFPTPRWVDQDIRVVPQIRDAHLYLEVERVRARIHRARPDSGGIRLFGALGNMHSPLGASLRLRRPGSPQPPQDFPLHATGPDADRTTFEVLLKTVDLRPASDNSGAAGGHSTGTVWDSQLVLQDGTVLPLVLDERESPAGAGVRPTADDPFAGGPALHVKPSPRGYVQICDEPVQPVVERVTPLPDGKGFTIEGGFPQGGNGQGQLRLRHDWTEEQVHQPVRIVGGRFTARVPCVPAAPFSGRVPLTSGSWELSLTDRTDNPAGIPLRMSMRSHGHIPAEAEVRGARLTLDRSGCDRLALQVHPALSPREGSAHRQHRLRTSGYPAARRRPLRDAVLYDVFGGKKFGDSPRALHEELVRRGCALEHLWVVRDGQVDLPPTARAVRLGSPEWYEALGRCRYLVGNTHFPAWIERREGQVVVQTWHGTPLKRIGHDFDNAHFSGSGYLEDLDRESRQWSLLLSPNRFSTPIMRRAFRYQGELLESGYPRNDLLCDPEAGHKRAEEVRRTLELPEGRKVVLYAPTWRENLQRHRGGFALDLRLDLDHARQVLGRDQVLLVRPHSHIVEAVPGAGNGFVRDVGSYPDITDLLLVADVLVTDYSSLMFDFAVTGKPMLFFTYDLEHYRDTLRGFYFDFEQRAPGPLLHSSPDLVAALRDPASATAPYRDAYRAFRNEFCDLDDGHAAGRVVDRMLALGARPNTTVR
jgi:CDP-glycerol glycerophosphotransferase